VGAKHGCDRVFDGQKSPLSADCGSCVEFDGQCAGGAAGSVGKTHEVPLLQVKNPVGFLVGTDDTTITTGILPTAVAGRTRSYVNPQIWEMFRQISKEL